MRLVVIILISSFLLSCGKENALTISGKYEDPIEGSLVRLEMIKDNTRTVVDSFYLDFSGEFEREVIVTEPAFYRLNFHDRAIVNLILNQSDVTINKNIESNSPSYLVTGSRDNDYLQGLSKLEQTFEIEKEILNQRFMQMRSNGDVAGIQAIRVEFLELQSSYNENLKTTIWEMDSSIAGSMAISYFDNMENEAAFIEKITIKYEKQLPDSYYTKYLRGLVDKWKVLAVGSPAPEIDLPNPEGTRVTLSSLRGKYVLIDFWAAWCRPCRQENPNVVRLYSEYNDKGFEILGVSLDRNKDAWVKAIENDNLTWYHVSDLKHFSSEAADIYQINAIPATYLIDPNGVIVAKNLRGSTLEAKLKEIFG